MTLYNQMTPEQNEALRKRLQEAKANGASVPALARLANVTDPHLYTFLVGGRGLSPEAAERLGKLLDGPPEALASGGRTPRAGIIPLERAAVLRKRALAKVEESGVSKHTFAKQIGLTYTALLRFLRGEKSLSERTAGNLEAFLRGSASTTTATTVGREFEKARAKRSAPGLSPQSRLSGARMARLRKALKTALHKKHGGVVAHLAREVGYSLPGLDRVLKGAGCTLESAERIEKALGISSAPERETKPIASDLVTARLVAATRASRETAAVAEVATAALRNGSSEAPAPPGSARELVARWGQEALRFVLEQARRERATHNAVL